jgi:hypothetical protein
MQLEKYPTTGFLWNWWHTASGILDSRVTAINMLPFLNTQYCRSGQAHQMALTNRATQRVDARLQASPRSTVLSTATEERKSFQLSMPTYEAYQANPTLMRNPRRVTAFSTNSQSTDPAEAPPLPEGGRRQEPPSWPYPYPYPYEADDDEEAQPEEEVRA